MEYDYFFGLSSLIKNKHTQQHGLILEGIDCLCVGVLKRPLLITFFDSHCDLSVLLPVIHQGLFKRSGNPLIAVGIIDHSA